MDFFGESITFKITPKDKARIELLVKSTDVYEDTSHFCRCAVRWLLQKEVKNDG